MNYCPNCGSELKNPNQKFCENCGASLQKGGKIESEVVIENVIEPSKLSGLFDLNRNYYILKEKYWDWGSGDILDDKGQIIGKMKRKILSIRKKVELREVDGTVSATIHAKILSARQAQDLKDAEGNLIARIKKKILTLLKPKFFLEAPDGSVWYEAQGNFMGFSFKVKDLSSGKIIAEIEKADRWRDYFLGGTFDFKDTYALRILDNETDRRILLGFVLSIDNVLHDQ
ncbi:MAG: zinc-ribbon domain-containing protein [Promethearchaeota archaeon]|nr:MAG: zinc-ribbon domain-containing protein [Candidatus Lokiarchaeota archaeon]